MQWKDPETILFFVHVILLCEFYNLDFFSGVVGDPLDQRMVS